MSSLETLDLGPYELPSKLTARLASPALVVYLDRVRENIARTLDLVGGPARWRPHVKTTKIPEVWTELVRAGVRHFKCATTREAALLGEVLDRAGVLGDVLLAYPLLGPNLVRFGSIAAAHPRHRWSVLVEEPARVGDLPPGVGVFVDLNPGMNRTGVPMADEERTRTIVRLAGDRFRGLHFYDGHHHEADPRARRAGIFSGYDQLSQLVARLGMVVEELVTAGTPAFGSALEYQDSGRGFGRTTTHRVSPGTVVFHDARSQEQNPQQRLSPAAVVFSRVVSIPGPLRITCDAGSKSLAAEAGSPVAVAIGRPELLAQEPSEEHLPFEVLRGTPPERGTEVYLVPRHVCPTVNLAEAAVLVDGDATRVVLVAARAHELLIEDL
jgi:D-serine deaminase-like pyridoxal phosphate-dependent protein